MGYVPGDRRPVFARVGGVWLRGKLAGWFRDRDGWHAYVWYRTGAPVHSSQFVVLAKSEVRDGQACLDCPAAVRVFPAPALPERQAALHRASSTR